MPKAATPEGRMGAYKSLSDVPRRHRLSTFVESYRDRDVWGEFLAQEVLPGISYERKIEDVHRYGRYWKEHTDSNGTHHALATPEVVESYSEWLIEDKTPITACLYWVRVDDFYEWLLWHADHPHRYNPVRMAAVEYENAGTLWEWQYQNHGGRDL